MSAYPHVVNLLARKRLDCLEAGRMDENHELVSLGFTVGLAPDVVREMDRIDPEHSIDFTGFKRATQ